MSNIRNLNQDNSQPQITPEMLEKAVDLECPSCGCIYVSPVVNYKLVNKLYVGSHQDFLVPLPTNRCSDCGEVFDIEKAVEAVNKKD